MCSIYNFIGNDSVSEKTMHCYSIINKLNELVDVGNIAVGTFLATDGLAKVINDISESIMYSDMNASIQYRNPAAIAVGTAIALYGLKCFKKANPDYIQ